jgi:hypothetical protein
MRWVARLRSMPGGNLDRLRGMPLGLDVWEVGSNTMIVAATDGQLSEIERRRLAQVDRLCTVADFQGQPQEQARRWRANT